MSNVRLVPMGDTCLSVMLDDRIDPAINARCVWIAARLEQEPRAGIRDVVPTFNAVAVHFDPATISRRDLDADLRRLAADAPPSTGAAGDLIQIPVEYGGRVGPDLTAVAEFAGCSERDVVRLHTAAEYRVYMLGFLPGFAYMGSVDERIAMPRLDVPRMRVAVGSVGIAGRQTGVYPCDTPGGWRIIGRTEVSLFDPARTMPFLLKAGDRVTFVPA
ncbi:MAG TPA: 5-oxoprolinase subunit PxpB [Vicinamibacterales bacterium]|nr:5-oxoprolinase subunit PxpB [Vicinamibacterales bacterium]